MFPSISARRVLAGAIILCSALLITSGSAFAAQPAQLKKEPEAAKLAKPTASTRMDEKRPVKKGPQDTCADLPYDEGYDGPAYANVEAGLWSLHESAGLSKAALYFERNSLVISTTRGPLARSKVCASLVRYVEDPQLRKMGYRPNSGQAAAKRFARSKSQTICAPSGTARGRYSIYQMAWDDLRDGNLRAPLESGLDGLAFICTRPVQAATRECPDGYTELDKECVIKECPDGKYLARNAEGTPHCFACPANTRAATWEKGFGCVKVAKQPTRDDTPPTNESGGNSGGGGTTTPPKSDPPKNDPPKKDSKAPEQCKKDEVKNAKGKCVPKPAQCKANEVKDAKGKCVPKPGCTTKAQGACGTPPPCAKAGTKAAKKKGAKICPVTPPTAPSESRTPAPAPEKTQNDPRPADQVASPSPYAPMPEEGAPAPTVGL